MSKPIPTIANLWKDFSQKVIPAGASHAQWDGMEKSFYAGVAGLMGILQTIDAEVGEETMSVDKGREILTSIEGEIYQFIHDRLQGQSSNN